MIYFQDNFSLILIKKNGAIHSVEQVNYSNSYKFISGKLEQYICRHCFSLFKKKQKVDEHILRLHIGPAKCPMCAQLQEDIQELKTHKSVCSFPCEVPECRLEHKTKMNSETHKKKYIKSIWIILYFLYLNLILFSCIMYFVKWIVQTVTLVILHSGLYMFGSLVTHSLLKSVLVLTWHFMDCSKRVMSQNFPWCCGCINDQYYYLRMKLSQYNWYDSEIVYLAAWIEFQLFLCVKMLYKHAHSVFLGLLRGLI